MKTTTEIFKEVLEELGFAGYKPSQMTNSDYWLCTCAAMERYAEQFKISSNPLVIKSVCEKCRFKAECRFKEMNTEQNCKYFIDEQTVL